jgi:hypothetical protein
MAISPNDNFTSGQVLTATECNQFPRGVMALATNVTTNYVITTSTVIATGMTVTFTAAASRNYKITYFEPAINTPAVSGGSVTSTIRLTNAAGTAYQTCLAQTNSITAYTVGVSTSYVTTLSAGSITLVGCLVASSTTGTPTASRNAAQMAYLIVEDIGTA